MRSASGRRFCFRDAPTGFLNLLTRRCADLLRFNRQLIFYFTAAKNLDAIKFSTYQVCRAQGFFVHDRAAFEILQIRQVHNRIRSAKSRVVESTLWQSPDQWHLSTFESETKTSSRASLLPFVSFAAGFAVARAFAAAESFHPMTRTGTQTQVMQP